MATIRGHQILKVQACPNLVFRQIWPRMQREGISGQNPCLSWHVNKGVCVQDGVVHGIMSV